MSQAPQTSQQPQSPAGRLSDVMAGRPSVAAAPGRIDSVTLTRVGILAALFILLHWRLLQWMVHGWWTEANWSHGFLLPLFSLYLVYTRWDDLMTLRRQAYRPGLIVLIGSIVAQALVLASPYRYPWLTGLGMIGALFGLVLYLCGPAVIRVVWLPIVYLALAVPIPGGLYTRMAYPLQEVAAKGAVGLLRLCGVDIVRAASSLSLYSKTYQLHELTVAEACSGMRLLMAFFALGVAMAYVENRPVWQRVALVLAGIPIAVFCNILRVAITCTAYYFDHPELGQNVLHKFTGMIMLVPAFAMLFVLGWVLNHLYIPVDDDEEGPEEEAPKKPQAAPDGGGG